MVARAEDAPLPAAPGLTDPAAVVATRLAEHGLLLRGGLHAGDGAERISTVFLVGQAGRAAWPHFQAWRARQPPDIDHPLDRWSREVIGAVARAVGAEAVSPSDKPYRPFQRWAIEAEKLKSSPLGILMHPRFGLWHAYRGALIFGREVPLPQRPDAAHLCDSCRDKPCLSACPVGAFTSEGFAVADCRAHLARPEGQACMSGGCLARNACPHGTAFRYDAEQQAFHMQSFAEL